MPNAGPVALLVARLGANYPYNHWGRSRASMNSLRGRHGCIRQELASGVIVGPRGDLRRAKRRCVNLPLTARAPPCAVGRRTAARGPSMRTWGRASVPPEPSCLP